MDMSWWQAILLGVVEGLTEYLPVSSTGHLLVVQALLGIGTDSAEANAAANAYAICIQAGAILAVLGLYWQRVKQCAVGWAGKAGIGPGHEQGFRIGLNMLVAFVPAAAVGLALGNWIEQRLFGMWPIVVAWFVGGLAILATAWWRKRRVAEEGGGADLAQMTVRMALLIGLIQCLAMWPGTSRSLVTIVGGVLVGMSLASAVEFSFLLGVITLCAATVYKAVLDTSVVMVDGQPTEMLLVSLMAREYGWVNMIIGSVAAYLSAVAAVTWMVAYLKKHGMEIFGYYRIAIAVVVAALLLAGVFDAAPDVSP
jgi:undecaprenyl-diphosphatase